MHHFTLLLLSGVLCLLTHAKYYTELHNRDLVRFVFFKECRYLFEMTKKFSIQWTNFDRLRTRHKSQNWRLAFQFQNRHRHLHLRCSQWKLVVNYLDLTSYLHIWIRNFYVVLISDLFSINLIIKLSRDDNKYDLNNDN